LGEYRAEQGAFTTWLVNIARRLAVNELIRASAHRERLFNEAVAVLRNSPDTTDSRS
jgi:DNA-directed RNA polymerase specialized sigma24 family protein